MWSQNYKGFTVHGYCDKTACYVMNGKMGKFEFKTLLGAKRAITSWVNAKPLCWPM